MANLLSLYQKKVSFSWSYLIPTNHLTGGIHQWEPLVMLLTMADPTSTLVLSDGVIIRPATGGDWETTSTVPLSEPYSHKWISWGRGRGLCGKLNE